MAEEMLPLNEVVRALRAELMEAAKAGADETVRFQVGPIDVEFTVVAKREGGPNGKIKFEVFGFGAELGGNAKFARERTQKVKLNLTPVRVQPDGTSSQLEINKVPNANAESEEAEEEILTRRP